MHTLINTVLQVCKLADQYHPDRTINSIFNHMMSEVGELGIEINIVEGQSYKAPGSDGILGESIDVVLSAVDLMYVHDQYITADDIVDPNNGLYVEPDNDRNSIFCDLSVRAGIVASRINQLKQFGEDVVHINHDASMIVRMAMILIKWENPSITENDLLVVAQPKLDKWISSIRKHQENNKKS